MRNIQTGYVSPQYHCVFDNSFETVFSSKLVTSDLDNICDEIFQDRRYWYDEEEYEDGKLVYCPPPLHELWMIKPERRDQR